VAEARLGLLPEGVIGALAQLLQERVIAGHALQRAAPEAVDAAVADVRDQRLAAPQRDHRHRRAHLRQRPVAPRQHALVRQPHGDPREVPRHRQPLVQREGPGELLIPLVLLKEALNRLHHELAGDLAALIAAHAVRDDVEAEVAVDAEAVLIVAAPPDVGEALAVNVHGRAPVAAAVLAAVALGPALRPESCRPWRPR
jgi:hypothetical protein